MLHKKEWINVRIMLSRAPDFKSEELNRDQELIMKLFFFNQA